MLGKMFEDLEHIPEKNTYIVLHGEAIIKII
jgi:hypothetical protein